MSGGEVAAPNMGEDALGFFNEIFGLIPEPFRVITKYEAPPAIQTKQPTKGKQGEKKP